MDLVGISSPNMRVTTYKEFENDVLPRIKKLGYNCIQMYVRNALNSRSLMDTLQDGDYGACLLCLCVCLLKGSSTADFQQLLGTKFQISSPFPHATVRDRDLGFAADIY